MIFCCPASEFIGCLTPAAMTSILRSSCRWMLSMFKSTSRVFVVTRAPASQQTLAAAFSSGSFRGRSSPAERWSPKGSRVRRHRQRRADSGCEDMRLVCRVWAKEDRGERAAGWESSMASLVRCSLLSDVERKTIVQLDLRPANQEVRLVSVEVAR